MVAFVEVGDAELCCDTHGDPADPPVLLMGGGIAQDIAVRHPGRVLSLTLVATTAAHERADPTPLPAPSTPVTDARPECRPWW